jgi:hypothetical protein
MIYIDNKMLVFNVCLNIDIVGVIPFIKKKVGVIPIRSSPVFIPF